MDGWNGERQIGKTLDTIEQKHIERYQFALKYVVDGIVLDASCGCGYGSFMLSKANKKVVGVDNSHEALTYAIENWNNDNIEYKEFDLDSKVYEELGGFDSIVSFETIEHLTNPIEITIEKFSKILKRGGTLILSHPENEKSPGGKFHHHFNIQREKMNRIIIDWGFEIKNEMRQPPRSGFFYHIVNAQKN
jgi:2-polyprenyl-3-methyl-5-hydroxy-6-metoxy-1,4-benzoquinol methylase